jgi:phosphoglycerate dehydrogenase-like enzyme
MKLLFLRKLREKDKQKILGELKEIYDIIIPETDEEKFLIKEAKDADIILGNEISKEVFLAAKKLKLFQLLGAGVDKLDLNLFLNRDVIICNSHSNSYYVAEYGFSLLMTLIKRISLCDRSMRGEVSLNDSDYLAIPDTLKGKTIGILGYGFVGKKFIDMLNGFDVKLFVYTKNERQNNNHNNIHFTTSLNNILNVSDYIFVAIPLTKITRNLIKKDEFIKMKKSALIVNVARGEIINQKDLYNALKERIISGAAIDVWYGQKSSSLNFSFQKINNILLSPYRAAYNKESAHLDDVIKNLKNFANGKELLNIVNIEEGY